jgi:exosortase
MAPENPSRSSRLSTGRNFRISCFAGSVLISVLTCWSSISALLRQAWYDQRHSYILLIVPISLFLLLLEHKRFAVTGWDWRAGGMLVLGGFAITPWSLLGASHWSAGNQLSLTIAALVAFWIAAFVLCFGLEAFHAFRFPLLFLFLLAPLPDFVLREINFILQSGSTEVAYSLFRLFGIPVVQSGFVLSLPGLNIEIAEECSGIRSSAILLVTSLALAHLYLNSGWRHLLVGVCVLPLAILKNGLRVFVLSTLAVYVDATWLEGRLHRNGGVLFFALALSFVIALIAWLRGSERKPGKKDPGGFYRLRKVFQLNLPNIQRSR